MRGFPAWLLHRLYHVSRVPTVNRKARVISDWILAFLFRRDVVSLGQIENPKRDWEVMVSETLAPAGDGELVVDTARREW